MKKLNEEQKRYPVSGLCRVFGISRQSYYQHKGFDFHKEAFKGLVIEYVRRTRKEFPRIGYLMLHEKCRLFFDPVYNLGRDAFYHLLRDYDLMLKWKKRRIRTTDSEHPYQRYPNLIKGFTPTEPCQLWVADITYVRLKNGFCYLSLVTDARSRKIVGWCLGKTLESKYTEQALRMALEANKEKICSSGGLIHHSDRGVQYACTAYTDLLKENNCSISMTQSGDPLENAMAERVNGILKQEWLHHYTFDTFEEAESKIEKVIRLYNTQRPHSALKMKTPVMVHDGVPYQPEEYVLEGWA